MGIYFKPVKTGGLISTFIILSILNVHGQTARLNIIDPLVRNETAYTPDISQEQKVVFLPDEGNPLKYITNELKKAAYDEIHLYLLTKPGSIIFDEINIIPETIQDFSGDFGEWRSLTSPGFKIIIHSENLTSVPEGLSIVKKITEFTGREVLVN